MNSRIESVLAAGKSVLEAAMPDATVSRYRSDAYGIDELPAVEVLRGSVDFESISDRADRGYVGFTLALYVQEKTTAETELDELHAAADTALHGSSQLADLGRGLRCTGTAEPEQVASADGALARMLVTYQIQTITRRGDLARAIS